MSSPGTLRFAEVNTKPSAPPAGYNLIYVKTDDILYLQDSSGIETPLGSSAAITSLTGEATATGPGASVITLSNSAIIGKVLTGFTPGPNSPVLATDTILQAFQKLQAQVSGSIGTAITALTGDVSATGPGSVPATVNFVGGASAASIFQSVSDTQAATSSNTASTIVKRDASGNFSSNIITASLNGNATTSTTSTNFSGSLSGDVTGTQSATVVSTVGGKSAANIAQSVTDTQAATSSNTASTIVKRDASGNFSAGVITANLTGNVSGTASNVTGIVAIANGGTGQTTKASAFDTLSPTTTKGDLIAYDTGTNIRVPVGTNGQVLTADSTQASGLSYTTPTTGTVTSVALSTPGVLYTVSGSPITTSGTLTLNLNTQPANTVFAGPTTGGATTPTFRALVSADIPPINLASTSNGGVTGILPIANGGTNSSAALNNNRIMVSASGSIVEAAALTNGQVLIGSTGAAPVAATFTAGSGISIVNAAGSVTVATTGLAATTTKTANYTILSTDSIIFVDTSGGAFTLTLPNPAALAGKIYRIIGTSGTMQANPVTLARFGSEKIEGLAASKLLQTSWGWFEVTTNGTDWFLS